MPDNFISSIASKCKNALQSVIPSQAYWIGRRITQLTNGLRNTCLPLLSWSIKNHHATLAKIFIRVVTDVNQVKGEECSPLALAFIHKEISIVPSLISKGANPNQRSGQMQWTPLHWAINNAPVETISQLLDSGANLHGIDQLHTPLFTALNKGKLEVAQLLLKKGASPDEGVELVSNTGLKRDTFKQSPIYAFTKRNSSLSQETRNQYIEFLLENKADSNCGSEHTSEKFTTTSLPCNFVLNPFQTDPNQVLEGKEIVIETPLYNAINELRFSKNPRDLSTIELLLNHKADVNKGSTSQYSNAPLKNRHSTPLAKAAEYNLVDCVKLLLQKGAKPNYSVFENDDKHDPLFWAVKNGNLEIVKLLLESTADAKTKGQKLLWFASKCPEICELLKQYGADDEGELPPKNGFVW